MMSGRNTSVSALAVGRVLWIDLRGPVDVSGYRYCIAGQ
jgi:hypothetical protein